MFQSSLAVICEVKPVTSGARPGTAIDDVRIDDVRWRIIGRATWNRISRSFVVPPPLSGRICREDGGSGAEGCGLVFPAAV